MRVDVPDAAGGRDTEVADHQGYVRVQPYDRGTEGVERFRDLRRALQERCGFEVSNEFALNVLLDVYTLHAEREGREAVAEAAGRPVATDGGEGRGRE